MAFVVDNSLAIAWCIATQATAYSRRLLVRVEREVVHASALWPFEFVNALWSLERRGNLRAHQVEGAIGRVDRLDIIVHGEPMPWRALLDLSRPLQLAVYDAAYLELARRLGLPLGVGGDRPLTPSPIGKRADGAVVSAAQRACPALRKSHP